MNHMNMNQYGYTTCILNNVIWISLSNINWLKENENANEKQYFEVKFNVFGNNVAMHIS